MNMEEQNDQFQLWLMDMEDSLERFRQALPLVDRCRLDYSAESLDFVEALALSTCPGVRVARASNESKRIDQFAGHVGEVFRKNLGGSMVFENSLQDATRP
jgi:hypothetical protein